MVANTPKNSTIRQPLIRGEYEEYHPYGTCAWWAGDSSIDVSRRRYRYTGMERDEETGLQVHGVRYYAPWLGRWGSADPAGLVDGGNRFAYSRSSPGYLSDPSGLSTMKEDGAAAEDSQAEQGDSLLSQAAEALKERAADNTMLSTAAVPDAATRLGPYALERMTLQREAVEALNQFRKAGDFDAAAAAVKRFSELRNAARIELRKTMSTASATFSELIESDRSWGALWDKYDTPGRNHWDVLEAIALGIGRENTFVTKSAKATVVLGPLGTASGAYFAIDEVAAASPEQQIEVALEQGAQMLGAEIGGLGGFELGAGVGAFFTRHPVGILGGGLLGAGLGALGGAEAGSTTWSIARRAGQLGLQPTPDWADPIECGSSPFGRKQ